jgi:hypothetical protein
MHVKGFDKDIGDVLAFLDNLVKVVVVPACDADAFAGICNDLLVIDDPEYLDDLLQEVTCLHGTHDALVLSEAAGKAPDQVFREQLRLLLDAIPVEELGNGLHSRRLEALVQVLIVDQQRLKD